MAAPSETYVDPSINANSGTGTIGDPYGDLQYALDTMTRDSTNGDRINIKSGTAEVLTGTLDFTGYGSPSFASYLMLEGYDSTAGDGGIGAIDGNAGNFTIYTTRYVNVKNLKLFNTGTAVVINPDAYGTVDSCEITESSTGGVLGNNGHFVIVQKCFVHNIAGYGVKDCRDVVNCYFANGGTDKFTEAVNYTLATAGTAILQNFFNLDGTSQAISGGTTTNVVCGNSVLSSAGTVVGVDAMSRTTIVNNNLIEGFSGTGGTGIGRSDNSAFNQYSVNQNAIYDCETDIEAGTDVFGDDNESLTQSPFAKTGSLPTDFTSATFWDDVYAYFAPVDTGNVYSGYPVGTNIAKGAVQPSRINASPKHPLGRF
jgi:hypothetical protein